MHQILLLAMGLCVAQAFSPLSMHPTTARRAESAVTRLQMSVGPNSLPNRRGVLYLASALAGGLVLPKDSTAEDLPIAVIGPAEGNLGAECVAALVSKIAFPATGRLFASYSKT